MITFPMIFYVSINKRFDDCVIRIRNEYNDTITQTTRSGDKNLNEPCYASVRAMFGSTKDRVALPDISIYSSRVGL